MKLGKILVAAVLCLTTGAGATSPDTGFISSGTISTLKVISGCSYASIMADDSVIIDWSCVQTQAAEYKARRDKSLTASFAFVLESLRNGTAIVK